MKFHLFDSTLERGNCKSYSSKDKFVERYVIDRKDLIKKITDSFITNSSHGFGVILGPTGTGKSFATRHTCCNMPKGTLYFEIRGVHEFPKQLAQSIGMRTERTIIGTIIGRWFPEPVQGYYQLPEDYRECLDYVIRRLWERSVEYTEKNNHSPCLFIDGVDLAKYDEKLFVKLVDLAKGYANEGGLRIIFGCSEGHIIPLLFTATSSSTRSAIQEVVDVKDEEAVEYLLAWGMDHDFSSRLVETIGSRMIFLERVVKFYHQLKSECQEEELFKKVVAVHC